MLPKIVFFEKSEEALNDKFVFTMGAKMCQRFDVTSLRQLIFSVKVIEKAQCLRDVAIKMNSSIDSANVVVANLKPLYFGHYGCSRSPLIPVTGD